MARLIQVAQRHHFKVGRKLLTTKNRRHDLEGFSLGVQLKDSAASQPSVAVKVKGVDGEVEKGDTV